MNLPLLNNSKKNIDEKNAKILQILFILYDHADDLTRDKLPLFAKLLCKFTPDPSSWTKEVQKFKMKFIQNYKMKMSNFLSKEEIKFLHNE